MKGCESGTVYSFKCMFNLHIAMHQPVHSMYGPAEATKQNNNQDDDD